MIVFLDRHHAIVAFHFFIAPLLPFDNSNQTTLENDTGESGFIHKNEHVDRIAILGESAGDEAKIVRERHSRGKYLLQFKNSVLGVERVLVAAALWSFDHNRDEGAIVLIQRWEPGRICKSLSVTHHASGWSRASGAAQDVLGGFCGFGEKPIAGKVFREAPKQIRK